LLDVIESHVVVAPIVKTRRSGALVVRHLLRDLELAAVSRVLCDAGARKE
jgi:hypothetical protein